MKKYKHIAFLTDFGLKDNFVGVMKGVLYNINPKINIIDITNNISAQNIIESSFLLENSYKYFPAKTIFLCVVDPGVGSERAVIIIKHKKYLFIAPDNGLLSFLLKDNPKIFKLNIPNKYISLPVSNTFHGRDIFAPAAGLLSKGMNINKIATSINTIKKLSFPGIVKNRDTLIGKIIYIDRFGNCISNITSPEFYNFVKNKNYYIKIKNVRIEKVSTYYQIKEKYGVIFNSFNRLEVFVPNNSAKNLLKIETYENIKVKLTGTR